MVGDEPTPDWLATDGLLAAFAKRRSNARRRYMGFGAEGKDFDSFWLHLSNQVSLGDDTFVAKSLRRKLVSDDVSFPKAQRRPPPPSFESIAARHSSSDAAIVAAHVTCGYSYQRIAEHFGMHFTSVGRIVRDNRIR